MRQLISGATSIWTKDVEAKRIVARKCTSRQRTTFATVSSGSTCSSSHVPEDRVLWQHEVGKLGSYFKTSRQPENQVAMPTWKCANLRSGFTQASIPQGSWAMPALETGCLKVIFQLSSILTSAIPGFIRFSRVRLYSREICTHASLHVSIRQYFTKSGTLRKHTMLSSHVGLANGETTNPTNQERRTQKRRTDQSTAMKASRAVTHDAPHCR